MWELQVKVTERIHAIKIPFKVPISPKKSIDRKVVNELGLLPFAVNPLVARAFASSLAAE